MQCLGLGIYCALEFHCRHLECVRLNCLGTARTRTFLPRLIICILRRTDRNKSSPISGSQSALRNVQANMPPPSTQSAAATNSTHKFSRRQPALSPFPTNFRARFAPTRQSGSRHGICGDTPDFLRGLERAENPPWWRAWHALPRLLTTRYLTLAVGRTPPVLAKDSRRRRRLKIGRRASERWR